MPELIGYDNEGNPQYSFSDEDKLKGISVRPYNALLDPTPVAAEQSPLPVDVTGVGAVPNETTGFTAVDKLFGLNGQERFQTWPERMVRSGVSLAHDVATGELPVTTLRREDVTDQPAPQGATADSPLIGRLLNLSPVAADPRDALIERTQDMAGLAGGATLGINPAEMTVASGMTKMAKNGAKLTPIEKNIDLSNLFSDTQKPGMALSALEKPAPVFYSALENAVNNITANKMPADQWLGTLTNAKGVRPEEMEWIGLKDFLAEQKGPVTKDQVQQYLDANKVELKEVNKGVVPTPTSEEIIQEAKEAAKFANDDWDTLGPNGRQQYENIAREQLSTVRGATKFSKYQLPGGTNYQEKLLTLPDKQLENLKKLKEEAHAASDAQLAGARMGISKEAFNELEIAKDAAWKKVFDIENAGKPKSFQSSHWDEPNVLAHVRMNDRVIDGKKSLHLEEIQSDWHQLARDKGYAVSADKIEKLRPQFDKIDEKLLNSNDEQLLGHPEVDGMLKMAVDKKIITPDEAKIYKQVSDTAQTGAVPDAPFKKTWHELVLKRMLREAAEKGYDRLSWTPGEAQAARYDLSKHVDNIAYNPNTGYFKAIDKNGNDISTGPVPKEKLAETIGKEAADKLLKTTPNNLGIHSLQNADLKIGGEGMKGFYDTIIPKALEKIGKEHGVKVKQGFVEGNHDASLNEPFESRSKAEDVLNRGGEIYAVDRNGEHLASSVKELKELEEEGYGPFTSYILGDRQPKQPIHYIDIPQSLKDQALRKGFPLFSSGVMLSPVEQSPFDNQPKLTPVPGNPFE